MDLRSLGCVAGLLAVSACTYGGPPATPPMVAAPPTVIAPPGPPRIAILLPLTGPMAGVAGPMLQAAQLALSLPGSPVLDVRDTGGDPQRASQAAQAAIQAGDRLILGPLTAPETATVGAIASGAQIAVLAFTSDPAAASPGVWTLGLTPGQQVQRLVAAARDDGRQHLAAILPQGALGDALQNALETAATDAGMETPTIQRSDPGLAGFTVALKTLSNYEARRGDLAARIKALREETDPDARQKAAELAAQPVAPPPFDALLVFWARHCGHSRSRSSANYPAPGMRHSIPPPARASSPHSKANTARRPRRMRISPSTAPRSPACWPARTIIPPTP
jgi:branched-chain amino acid transport system substrate-binding protein